MLFRQGCPIAVAGLMAGVVTVRLWEAPYAFLMFLPGSGAWMRDHAALAAEGAPRPYALS